MEFPVALLSLSKVSESSRNAEDSDEPREHFRLGVEHIVVYNLENLSIDLFLIVFRYFHLCNSVISFNDINIASHLPQMCEVE